ncbi:MAG TPA: hypothetical protein VE988_19190 [Gemmataceae bacterium]|nr:hypothetical protein [Gemmataceae bacterium]
MGSTRFTHFGARFQCGIFAPDGKTFGFVGGSTNVNIWDVTSGKLFDLASDGGKAFQSISPVFSRDGKTLVVAQDNAIVVWSLAEKKRLQRLTATPEFFPRAIALTDNDKTVIGVSHDGALRWGTLPRAWKIAFGGRSNQNQNSPNMMTCLRKLSVMR